MAFNRSTDISQVNNDDDDDDSGLELQPLPVLIPTVVVVVLVVMVAATGNLLVLVSYARDARLRTVSNLYLLHLAVCDLLLATVSMPLYLVQTVFLWDWPFGTVFCKVYLLNDYTLCAQSVFLVILISLDQLLILRTGVHYATVETKGKAYAKVTIAWLVSFLIYGPAIIGWDYWVGYSVLEPLECDVEFYTNVIYTSAAAVLEFVLPALALSGLNFGVYWEIRKRTKTGVFAAASNGVKKETGLNSDTAHSSGNERVNPEPENGKTRKTSLVVSTVESLRERFRRPNQVLPAENIPESFKDTQEKNLSQCIMVESVTTGESSSDMKQMAIKGQPDSQQDVASALTVTDDSTIQNGVCSVTQNKSQSCPKEEMLPSAQMVHTDSALENGVQFSISTNDQLCPTEQDSPLANGVRHHKDQYCSKERDSQHQNGVRFVTENNDQTCSKELDFQSQNGVRFLAENNDQNCSALDSGLQNSERFATQNQSQHSPDVPFKNTPSSTLAAPTEVTKPLPSKSLKRSLKCFPVRRLMTSSGSKRQFNRAVRKEMKAARALFIFVFAFLVLWSPYTIATVVIALCDGGCVNELVYEFFVWLLWFKAVVNPFLYAANNSRFKMNFIQILSKVCFCCRTRWNSLLAATTNRNVTSLQ